MNRAATPASNWKVFQGAVQDGRFYRQKEGKLKSGLFFRQDQLLFEKGSRSYPEDV